LQNVHRFRGALRLPRFVNVRKYGVAFAAQARKYSQSFVDARSAVGLAAGAVRFIETGLEDEMAGDASGGAPEFIEPLSRAAVATGIDGLFVEVHEEPSRALSDGANALRLDRLAGLLERLRRIDTLVKSEEFLHETDSPRV